VQEWEAREKVPPLQQRGREAEEVAAAEGMMQRLTMERRWGLRRALIAHILVAERSLLQAEEEGEEEWWVQQQTQSAEALRWWRCVSALMALAPVEWCIARLVFGRWARSAEASAHKSYHRK
jgi:hypothetical protein